MIQRILITFLLLLSAIPAVCTNLTWSKIRQSISVHSLTPENGLSHSRIYSVYRDEFGFIWIGTEDGLNRYDGNRVEVFRPSGEGSINTNIVTSLCGDRNGHIFIMGRRCLSMLDLRTMKFSILKEEYIKTVEFSSGLLYYATEKEVYSYDTASGEHTKIFTLIPKNHESITDLCHDKEGSMYVALNNDQILKINREHQITEFSFANLHRIQSDEEGNIWLTSRSEGFSIIRPDGETKVYNVSGNISHAIDWNNVRSVKQIGPAEYFIGTYAGLAHFDMSTGIITPYDYELGISGFKSKSVSNLHFSDGILFIGTFHAGLHYYIRENDIYKTYGPTEPENSGISSPIVSSIIQDKRDVLWIGTVSGGLNIIDPKGRISSELKKKLKEEYLTNVKYLHYDEKEDALYACLFSEGICRIDIGKGRIRKASPIFYDSRNRRTVVSQNITRLIPVNDERCIALSLDGIMILDKRTMRLESLMNTGIPGIMIDDIGVDSDSNLWIAYAGNLTRMNIDDQDRYRSWTADQIDGMSEESFITSIFIDKSGNIWLGSSGSGIFLWDKTEERFKNWSTRDGLANSYINDITQSKTSEMIYLATNEGVTSFNPIDNKFENHNIYKGFPLTITDKIYASPDSTLYACGANGITAIKESALKNRHKEYRIYIKDIYINNSKATCSDDAPLKNSTLYQKQIELSGNTSSLSFDIVNSSLDPLLMTAFEYSLEGFDNDFITARGNQVTYTNLTAGKYTLIIRGTIPLSNGEFPVTKMQIEINPIFYKSWWFLCLISFLCISLTLLIIYSHVRGAKLKVLLELEKREKEHEKKLSVAKSSFLTNISHEFRTPLTLINSHIEILLQKRSLEPEIYSNLLGAYRNTGKLREMIDEFIDFNKSDSSEFSITPSPYPANDLVKEMYFMFTDYAASRKIRYTFNASKDEPWINVDYSQMSRAIINLISNAFKYTKDEICISTDCTRKEVNISVSDNGIGIEKSNVSRIFERFYQEERANMKTGLKGSGIGLSFASEIVNRHSGEIKVESTPDVNTVFTICLERCEAPADKIDICPIAAEDEYMTETEENEEKEDITVLIVEDNPDILDILSRIFSTRYSVITATNGAEGLEKATKQQPDIIISDIMMPVMSGTEMCHLLKNNYATSHIPLILLTALSSESHTLEGLNMGADDYVTKPFNSKILLARCRNLIRNKKNIHESYAHSASETEEMLTQNPIDAKLLKEAVAIIESNICDSDFDILSFARQLCLSRTLLFKKIKSLTGMTPNMFVLSIKLKRAAQEIIANRDENIADIAYRCGFNTPSYFIKCFKKFYGVTPLVFRKNEK